MYLPILFNIQFIIITRTACSGGCVYGRAARFRGFAGLCMRSRFALPCLRLRCALSRLRTVVHAVALRAPYYYIMYVLHYIMCDRHTVYGFIAGVAKTLIMLHTS
jgi:hypothetical protein